MQNLIISAIDTFLSSFRIKLEECLINFFMQVLQVVNSLLLTTFDIPMIVDFVEAGIWMGRILFGATFVILLIDIMEENGSWKSDQFKAIEWTTIFLNLMKAAVFVETAPRLTILSMKLVADSVNQFDPTPYLNGMKSWIGTLFIGIIISIIAVGGFAVVTIMRFGAILIQAFTAFLYVPDIVRGHTTSMGSWIRQTVAILLTFFLQYVFFFLGLVACLEVNLVVAAILWMIMIYVAKYLDKYGMSSGVTGAFSSAQSMVKSASDVISMFNS